jgi:effector-binding domain-containing protein
MTAPVITSAQIPMTSPVVSDEQSMSFVMPRGKEKEEMPDPLDHRVKITTLPPREIAVIRFKGYAGREDVHEVKSRLLDGLKKSGIATRGQPVLMRYNAPWTPGFLRRNEVGIEITR